MDDKASMRTNCISNSATLSNNYFLLLTDLCTFNYEENGVVSEAIVLQ